VQTRSTNKAFDPSEHTIVTFLNPIATHLASHSKPTMTVPQFYKMSLIIIIIIIIIRVPRLTGYAVRPV